MIMTQNATVKKNQNEMYEMIITAQFMHEGRQTHLVQTTTFAVFSFFKTELIYGTSVYANHLCHMTLVAKSERDSAKHRYKLIECVHV